jgi:hypothetical protein
MLCDVSTSQPSTGFALQSTHGLMHDWIPQLPPAQTSLAFGRLHTLPQPPQFWRSVLVTVSHPSTALPLQSA